MNVRNVTAGRTEKLPDREQKLKYRQGRETAGLKTEIESRN